MAETKKVNKDNYLFREGDQPDAMYIIKSGSLAITKSKGNSEITLAELGPGSMVGEMALFDRKPRSANVKASRETEVIALPYDSLQAQLESMPVWIKAIIKSLNENLREANKKIKILESTTTDDERFPPHIINKFLSIINFTFLKYGKPDGDNAISVSSNTLRNYTIQIFQEATNKMQSVVNALCEMGYMKSEDRGDGTQKLINYRAADLFSTVEWYNDWLFKQEKDRLPQLKDEEIKILNAIVFYAKKIDADKNGIRKVSLNEIQNESMKDLGFLVRVEDTNSLVEKKYLPEKVMDSTGTFLNLRLEDIESYSKQWDIINNLKKKLR